MTKGGNKFLVIALIVIVAVAAYFLFTNVINVHLVPQTKEVVISGITLEPASVTISVGDSVVWKAEGTLRYVIDFTSGADVKSDELSPGESFTYTFTTAGTYNYMDAHHPWVKGTITVQ